MLLRMDALVPKEGKTNQRADFFLRIKRTTKNLAPHPRGRSGYVKKERKKESKSREEQMMEYIEKSLIHIFCFSLSCLTQPKTVAAVVFFSSQLVKGL